MPKKIERDKYGEPLSRLARLRRAAQAPLLLPIEPPPCPWEQRMVTSHWCGTDGLWHKFKPGSELVLYFDARKPMPNSEADERRGYADGEA